MFSIHKHSYKYAMHLIDIAGKDKDQRRKSKVFQDKPSFLKRIRRSIVAKINIQFWKYTIPFGSINPESHTFLRFRSGASTRSLVSSYDSVREHQPEVSYPSAIPFGSINPESHIFLRFRSGETTRSLVFSFIFIRFRPGATTRSLVFSFISYDSVREKRPGVSYFLSFSYDSVREQRPGVSYFLSFHTIPFGSNDLESHISFLTFLFGRCDNLQY